MVPFDVVTGRHNMVSQSSAKLKKLCETRVKNSLLIPLLTLPTRGWVKSFSLRYYPRKK